MMRIERCAARPRRAALRPARSSSPIQREAGLGLPRQLPARIVLGDEFHIPMLGATVLRFVLDPEIRQFQMPVDDRQVLRVGERLEIRLVTRAFGAIVPMQKRLIVMLQLVIEDHSRDAPAVVFQPRRLHLIEAVELHIVPQFARLHETFVVLLARLACIDVHVEQRFALRREDDEVSVSLVGAGLKTAYRVDEPEEVELELSTLGSAEIRVRSRHAEYVFQGDFRPFSS